MGMVRFNYVAGVRRYGILVEGGRQGVFKDFGMVLN